ncbi:hypothetical protein GKA01_12030 [Gluconobacter kanchanaburiensis NBRC 103587]|uniref:Uncharacterized protein n=1 Tax=Gluconobacter kanchanaburiensis NBRC 103587 TaxID=1307948 RepID=A0A511B6E8_9PROT|nr:hypothetical protein AA103587_2058 [Gluconobacter kanchanaburiensis NBRC 103587]GEK96006.1 hypothetical protein GKA01_12030 [Gluconobacter kanchanaburiensis NBRC 103587]
MGCQDFSGREIVSFCDCAQNTSVNHPFGQGEQQIQHPATACDFFQQAGMPGANAWQARQRREERCQSVFCVVRPNGVRRGVRQGRWRKLFGRHRDNGRFPCSSG